MFIWPKGVVLSAYEMFTICPKTVVVGGGGQKVLSTNFYRSVPHFQGINTIIRIILI